MTFQEAARRYGELRSQWQSGGLDREGFIAAVYQLQVQDADGTWWQVDPETGGWLTWNGTAWVGAAHPPVDSPGASIVEPASCAKCQAELSPGASFCAACGEPVDTGAAFSQAETRTDRVRCSDCGASVPREAAFCKACGVLLETSKDLLGSGKKSRGSTRLAAGGRFHKWNQRVWDVVCVTGSAAMAGAWYWYSGLRGRPDTKTSAAMVLLPLALVVLRPFTDRLLMPLQKIRSKVPRFVLLGIGLAVPLLVSNFYYKVYYGGRTLGQEYPFMFKTYLTSVLASYVILRTPSRSRD